MFKKLLANLPFNPSLISQVAFYTDRLKQEKSIRRLSLFFIMFTMLLQMFAVIVPPEKSLAASDNHILDGLTETKSPQANRDYLLQSWDNSEDIRAIYGTFGVTRDDIAGMELKKVTVFSGSADYWTIGRNSLYGYSKVSQQYKDTQVTIQYSGTATADPSDDRYVYNRQLKAWDIVNKTGNYYSALKGTIQSTGETFWILYDCGNLTKLTRYAPPPPPAPAPPIDPLNATCSVAGPLIIPVDATTITFPVQIGIPAGSTMPAGNTDSTGSGGNGLHLSVTSRGDPSTWDKYTIPDLAPSPPDKQSNYIPLNAGTVGLGYYEFVWSDGHTYRRYYVKDAHSSNFTVTMSVRVNSLDKKLVVRLLDRERGEWLPYNSTCEVAVQREVPPPAEPTPPPVAPTPPPVVPTPPPVVPTPPVVPPTPPTPPTPEPPKPELDIRKSILNKPAFMKPGDSFTYVIQYRNKVNASLAENVVITDELDTRYFNVDSVSPVDAKVTNGFLKYERGSLPFSNDYQEIRVNVTLKDQISSGTNVCNVGRISADMTTAVSTSPVCIGVITPCPYDASVDNINNPNCAEPKIVCELLTTTINRTTRTVDFKTTISSTNQPNTTIYGYKYNFGDKTPEITKQSTSLSDETSHTFVAGTYTATVVVTYGARGVAGKKETACVAPVSFDADQALGKSKTVINKTQDKVGKSALETKLHAGDVLEYTLVTTNIQNYDRTGITISDYIGDVLEYAILDEAFLKGQGGVFDSKTKKITWSNLTIPANKELVRTFRVTIKSPIPTTNSPSGVTTGFDCKISNEYGNEITINIDCPLVKGIETLPKTGPGASVLMLTFITTLVGYFFARSRLLVKELSIVRTDYAMTGGM